MTKSNYKIFEKLLSEIEQKLNWGNATFWTNKNYSDLSEKIEKETGIKISLSSVRRMFGRTNEIKNPQTETKNALARFAGYNSWDNYKMLKSKSRVLIIKLIISIFTSLAIISFGSFLFKKFYSKRAETTEMNYNLTPLKGKAPLTVTLNYSIPKNSNLSYSIYFGEYFHNKNYIKLDEEKSNINYTYYRSYVYRVYLKNNGIIADTSTVVVKSDFWDIGAIDESHSRYVKINKNDLELKNLHIPTSYLKSKGIDTLKGYYTEFKKVDFWGVPLNKMKLSFKYKQKEIPGSRGCYDLNLVLRGNKSDIKLISWNKGCESLSEILIGNTKIKGRYHELNNFSFNLSEWNSFEINSQKDTVKILINKKEAYSGPLKFSNEELKLIHFYCKGASSIKDVKLNNENDNIIFNDFN